MLRLLLALFCLQTSAWACIWDNDTLAAEAEGVPNVIRVITGRFPRNPPLYYEMRLKRVASQIEAQPEQLELYDDAGVAADRLHRGDEAVSWMEKKRLQLEKRNAKDPKVREHWYRYHANIGTFYAHRWLREGGNRKRINEMDTARDHIARAIEINPDAHFGREKYQLQVMEWIINPPKVTQNKILPTFLSWPEDVSPEEAVEGLSGLIVLGDAWQSVDIFNALAQAVQGHNDRSSVSYLARLRARELVEDGKGSILPTAPTGAQLQSLFAEPLGDLMDSKKAEVENQFHQLRGEADEWQRLRTEYMMTRLEAGRHPDTDETFWNEWVEPPAPSLSSTLSTSSSVTRSGKTPDSPQSLSSTVSTSSSHESASVEPSNRLWPLAVIAGALSFSLAILAVVSRRKIKR